MKVDVEQAEMKVAVIPMKGLFWKDSFENVYIWCA